MTKWIRKHCLYYHVVTEKLDTDRHVHAALVLNKEMTKSNIITYWSRLFPNLTSEERRYCTEIKIWYNYDWLDQYLNKDDDTRVVQSSLPEAGFLNSYFPDKPTPERKSRCSPYYVKLEKLWFENITPGTHVNTVNVRNFLFDMMYSKRLIDVIRDDKGIVQVARHLTRFLNKSTTSTIELPPFEKEE